MKRGGRFGQPLVESQIIHVTSCAIFLSSRQRKLQMQHPLQEQTALQIFDDDVPFNDENWR